MRIFRKTNEFDKLSRRYACIKCGTWVSIKAQNCMQCSASIVLPIMIKAQCKHSIIKIKSKTGNIQYCLLFL